MSDITHCLQRAKNKFLTAFRFFLHNIIIYKKKILIIVASIIGIAIVVFFLLRFFAASNEGMELQLENYATEMYNKELKDRGASGSYTLNLNYFERRGYNLSSFTAQGCNMAGTYAIVSVNNTGNIIDIKTHLQCDKPESD